ncbi:esterase-like activity of phytase family protein [Sphingomonas parva]|uniref:Esterase-like activity of phytase family protein n=1 Tax=Sphingomonas parva TaxID=2555898 RepID=A0A4Y8ZZ24_9SPHN|nr:esterase-like activity of phytase family protein [Sphingomonas parva]TFI59936.1 esterase-like activity of phytase family protein [Sphingomonas parva]
MRVVSALLFLFFLGTFAPVRLMPPNPPPAVAFVSFEPLEWRGRRPVGPLRWLGAWRLESNDWRFGGLSAMHVENGKVLAVSDSGWMIRFPLVDEGPGRATISPLPGRLGATARKPDRDVESLVVHGRYLWLGMERKNAVWRFAGPVWQEDGRARPAGMAKWSENRGAETMVRLRDGRFLVIAEGARNGLSEVLIFLGDPATPGTTAIRMRYKPPQGYRVTDGALLPDGRVLLLHRRTKLFEGITAKLALADLSAAKQGDLLVPQEIAALAPPQPVDNMEALSVTRENGRTIVWIASDDNYMPLQRTLLLKFALD